MNEPADLAVACRSVTIAYGPTVIVPHIDVAVRRGEMVALLGPSGSGKTTLLSAVAGFIPIQSGEIMIGGRTVATADRSQPPERRDVAVVFQSYALWPHLSALETVAYPIRRRGIGAAEARRRSAEILDMLGIGQLAHRRPAELSGGEQQRVGLGRALAREAGLYLFDEPTAHLDTALRDHLQAEIAEQRRRSGAAALYATHDTAEALALADRVVLIREGRIVQEGSPMAVYERPADLWAASLTGPVSEIDVQLTRLDGLTGTIRVADTVTTVAVASDAHIQAGAVRAMVRPDWVRLGGDLPGRVEAVAFRGTHTDYRLATPAGRVVVRASGPVGAGAGDAVTWSIERLWIPAPG